MLRLAVVLCALALLGAVWALGGLELLLDAERMKSLLTESGAWGPAGFVVAFALINPFGVPGIVFLIPASMVWPLPLALLVCWIGATGSGLVGFAFARWVARDFVARRIPASLARLDERIQRNEIATILTLRVFLYLNPLAHWALGLSGVNGTRVVWGTAIGFVPMTCFFVLGGRGLLEVFMARPEWIPALAALGIAVVLALLWWRRRQAL
ncbi:MAG: VTT domain-containing protein [Myxococcota bacterium]|nr:VTT domain-containing protein [Myxococcota bacterium]